MEADYRTPGQLIEALLEERGWDRQVLAVLLGIERSGVSKLLSGMKRVDAQTALALGEVFGEPPERFLELQQSYDLAAARILVRPDEARATRAVLFGQLPITEMIKRGWLRAESIRDIPNVEAELARFFDVLNASEIPLLAHAAKKSEPHADVTPTQLAWIQRVNQVARQLVIRPYSPSKAQAAIPKLRDLLLSAESVRYVPRILSDAGIRFVIVESLKSGKIDGVTTWLGDDAPVIGLSLRLDRLDNFWFCLRHELEHVLCGHGKGSFVLDAELEGERAGTGQAVSEQERVANEAAANFCVPATSLQQFIARKQPIFAERDIVGFARTLRIHPGLVAGQIQHKTGRYELFRKYLVKIRSIVSPDALVDGWGDVAPTGA